MKNVLIMCTGNSCRSQIAQGYLEQFLHRKANIYSAGIKKEGLNPKAVCIMKEDGIDISKYTSNHIDEYVNVQFDYIITVCDNANENCPTVLSEKAIHIHHNFTDPSKTKGNNFEIQESFKKVRDQIKNYFKKLAIEIIEN